MALSTLVLSPRDPRGARAVVCLCHGYSDNLSYSKKVEYQRLVEAGFVVVGVEYEGHGRSDGTLCLIESWEDLVDDVSGYFRHALQHERERRDLPAFLMGESMGCVCGGLVIGRARYPE
jgi:acylglycerol lipase